MKIKRPASHHETFFTFPVISNYKVCIIFTDDISASVNYLASRDNFNIVNNDDRVEGCVACHLHPQGRGYSYLVFNPTTHAGSIAHECWHMVYNLMDWAGIKLEDEFVAYHLGHAVQKVVTFQYEVQRRTQNVDSGRGSTKAGTGRAGRSLGNSSKSKTPRSTRIHGTPKVRRS